VRNETQAEPEKRHTPPCLPLNAQLAELAARQHGVVTAAQLRTLGLGYQAMNERVRSGALHRVHRGVYAVGHGRLSDKGTYMAAVQASGKDAALAGLSAAALWKAWRRKVPQIEVLAPKRRRQHDGFVIHTTRHVHPSDITTHDGIPVTTMSRTLVDLTDALTAHQLANVIHEAAFRNRFDLAATKQAIKRANGRRNLVRLIHALALNAGGSAGTRSELEDRFLELVDDEPRVNTKIEGIEVDVALPGLVIEIDGPGHLRPRTQREDRERERRLNAAGYDVIRVAPRP